MVPFWQSYQIYYGKTSGSGRVVKTHPSPKGLNPWGQDFFTHYP